MKNEHRVIRIGKKFFPQFFQKTYVFFIKDYYRHYKITHWDDESGNYSVDVSFETQKEAWEFIDLDIEQRDTEVFYRDYY